MKKLILPIIKTVVPLFLGAYLIWHSFSSMSKVEADEFYKAIKGADYFWIITGLVLSFIAFLSRAQRWKLALEPLGQESKFWNRYHAIMIGYIINLTIPRAGEASRAAMLHRSDGVPFSISFGSIIAERAVDFIILASIGAITAFVGYADFFSIMDQIKNYNFGGDPSGESGFPWFKLIVAIIAIGGVFFIVLLIKKQALRAKIFQFIKDVIAGLFSIFRLKKPLAYLGHTVLIWVCYLFMFGLPFLALEETSHISLAGILLGFIAGSLGVILTNGGIGTYPILVGLVVAFYIGDQFPGKAMGIGTALGWIIWLSQTLLLIILGLISLVLLPKNYSKDHEQTTTHSTEKSQPS